MQRGEGRSAALMIGHSFFMGASTVFFETAASALFLSQFEKQALPWVYMAAAVLNVVTGAVYSGLRARAAFDRLMAGTLLFLLVSVCALRVGLLLSSAAWLVFASLVWYRVLSILTDLEYWAVAARLYDLRQAKRLFGLIGTGEVVARILGSFSVPLFVGWIGVANLLWLSAAGLALCLGLVTPALRLIPARPARGREPGRGRAKGVSAQLREVVGDPYLLTVTAIAVLAVLGKYFVDFAFLEQMKVRFSDVENLAGFFGIFSGLTQGLSLLTRLLLSRPLLERYGIKVGLLVLPLVQLACTLLIVLAGAIGEGQGALVFWLVIANQGVYKTLKHPIDNPSFKVLYQPLSAERRLTAQISVEAIFTPLAIGVAGGIMLMMSTLIRYDPVRFSYVLLGAFAAWALVARTGSRAYQRALLEVLRRRIVEDAPFTLNDATSLALLRTKLASATPAEVIFALHLLERAEDPGTQAALVERLGHASPEVRRYAFERLGALPARDALAAVRRHAATEHEPRPLAAAVRALGALGDDLGPELPRFVSHPDAGVRRAALAALLGHAQPEPRAPALERLAALSGSPESDNRLQAALALGECLPGEAEPLLAGLLQDAVPAVRRAALHAARRASPALLPLVVEGLGEPACAGAAAAALAAAGEAAVPALAERFIGGGRRATLVQVVRVLGRIGGARALALLRAQLAYPDQTLRGEAILALLHGRYAAGAESERAPLLARLRDEAAQGADTLAAWRDLPADPAFAPLRDALLAELQLLRRRCFALLAFVYDREAIQRARDNVAHASRDKRAYAVEILDVTIEPPLRGMLLPLLDERPPESRLAALAAHFALPPRPPQQRLRELLLAPEGRFRGWTVACAARAAAAAGLIELKDAIQAVHAADPLPRETAAVALRRLATGGDAAPPETGVPMLLIEKVLILKGVQIFAETAEEILAEIAGAVEELELRPGEAIFAKGDAGDSMYVIVEGQVRVHDGDRTINVLGEREIFGELALLDPEPRSASCAALTETRLFRLDAETFAQLMAGNIEIVRGVLHVLCERLRRVVVAAPAR